MSQIDDFSKPSSVKVTGPLSEGESKIFLFTTFLILVDAVTTLTFYLTKSGFELNPILGKLLEVNPFTVYPFLISALIPFFLFRFNPVSQKGVAVFLILTHFFASLNNIGLIFYQNAWIVNFWVRVRGGLYNIQFISFIIGLIYIGVYTTYISFKNQDSIKKSFRRVFLNYSVYLIAYMVVNVIPLLWIPVIRLL
ncbi:hypothetical protein FJY84_06795 [Candidatus Bathyarchaeota archaeon]|nr:hypothetical protein [Candidatus Bathyarchaeota archaeon]